MGLTSNLKYIVVDDMWGNGFYMFPAHVNHADFVRMIGFKPDDVLSAGFVNQNGCFGKATTLGKEAKKGDTELFRRLVTDDD